MRTDHLWFGPCTAQEQPALLELLEASFPPEERRTDAGQRFLMTQPDYTLMAARQDGHPAGLLAWWQLADFRFIEHFAVSPALRGQGLGGKMLDSFLQSFPEDCVLEVEPPETPFARRRIGFYLRHGLALDRRDYLQLPLRPGDKPAPLLLMSRRPMTEERFVHVRDALYARVYTCGVTLV